MQRWGSEQEPGSSVLLRTGALMSLASLGTAGLVLCGALAVSGPGDLPAAGALGTGPTTVEADDVEPSTAVRAAQPVRRTSPAPDRPTSRPTSLRDEPRAPALRADAVGSPLSGTTTWAVRAPDDDSVVHPARGRVVVAPSPAQAPVAPPSAPAPVTPPPAPAEPPVVEAPAQVSTPEQPATRLPTRAARPSPVARSPRHSASTAPGPAPAAAVRPAARGERAAPARPAGPTKPARPAEPDEQAGPAKGAQAGPSKAAKQAGSDKPSEPAGPDTPEPAGRVEAEQPARQSQPAAPPAPEPQHGAPADGPPGHDGTAKEHPKGGPAGHAKGDGPKR